MERFDRYHSKGKDTLNEGLGVSLWGSGGPGLWRSRMLAELADVKG